MKRTWLLTIFMATPALAQINAGSIAPTAEKPFIVTKVAEFNLPWRMAFLPDGRMLITEKGGKVFLATPDGNKTEMSGVPAVQFGGQNGLLGIYTAPTFAKDRGVYLTYSEPGQDPATSSLALAHATLGTGKSAPSLDNLKVIWRDPIKGKGGQVGATIAFSPDGTLLYLTVGERQRFTPAQDPNQPAGKILRLTMDGKPAPGNPMAGKTGTSTRRRDRSAEEHRSRQDRAGAAHLHLRRSQPDPLRDMELGPSHALWPRLCAGRKVVGSRTWSTRWRRT